MEKEALTVAENMGELDHNEANIRQVIKQTLGNLHEHQIAQIMDRVRKTRKV